MSYRSIKRAFEKDYKRYTICWWHGNCKGIVTCPAISLKNWLRRKGYGCGQYQGIVKTDAGLEAIGEWAHQFVARNLQDDPTRMFDKIPTSVLAFGHISLKDAPRWGYGLSGKSDILPVPLRELM